MLMSGFRPNENTNLGQDQIEALIKHFLEKLIKRLEEEGKISKEDAEHLRSPEVQKNLAFQISHALKRDGENFRLSQLNDPSFTEKFLVVCSAALMLEKNFKNDAKMGLERLLELQLKIKEFENEKRKSDPEFKMKPEHLALILSEKEILELKGLLEKSQKETVELTKTPQPEPEPDSGVQKDPVVSNWLGLLSNMTGGLAATVTYVVGNYMGLNDWNPNDGDAPVDTINSVSDNKFGDPLGLNEATMINYISQGVPIDTPAEEKLALHLGDALEALPLNSPTNRPT